MRSIVATHQSCRKVKKPTGVTKLASSDPQRPHRALRSLDEYFWYTSADSLHRLATSCSTLDEIPRQVNDYVFNTSTFADAENPSTFPEDRVWPPEVVHDLVFAIDPEGEDCVSDRCYTNTICKDPWCSHTFNNWTQATRNWQDHFELRKTEDRGIGVYTKRAFRKGDVLGWYAGELVPEFRTDWTNDYLMEMPMGSIRGKKMLSNTDSEIVIIDGSRKGN